MSSGSYSYDYRPSRTDSTVGFWYKKTWYGQDDPKKVRENSYTVSLTSGNNPLNSYRVWDNIQKKWGDPIDVAHGGAFGGCAGQPHVWSNNDEIALLGKLAEKIRGHSFNAAVTLGESKKSWEMLTEAASTLYKAARLVRRGQLNLAARQMGVTLKKSTKVKENFADNWLALKYGWMPLVNDSYEAFQAILHHTMKPRVHSFRVTRFSAIPSVAPISAAGVGGPPIGNCQFMTRRSYKYIAYEVQSWPANIGLTNPASLVWELIPYSFVADWFIPIGSWIDTRSVMQSVNGYWVRSHLESTRLELLGGVSKDGVYSHSLSSAYTYKRIEFQRSTGNSLLVPPRPTFKPLSEVPTIAKCTSAIALLINGFKKR